MTLGRYIVIILLLAGSLACQQKSTAKSATGLSIIKAEIKADKDHYTAGSSVRISISFDRPQDSIIADLIWSNGVASISQSVPLKHSTTVVNLPKEKTQHASVYSVSLVFENQVIARDQFEILPSEPTGEAQAFTGPRSIWSYEVQPSMVTTIFSDKYGNPIDQPEPIRYDLSSQKGQDQVMQDQQNQLFSSITFNSNAPDHLLVGAANQRSSIATQAVESKASDATEFSIIVVEHHDQADGQHASLIKTSRILDQGGYAIANGTLIDFLVADKQGRSSIYQSYTIDGVASVHIQSPTQTDRYVVSASVDNMQSSNEIILRYASQLSNYRLQITKKTSQMRIGLLSYDNGQMVPDGLSMNVTISKNGNNTNLGDFQVFGGYVHLDMQQFPELIARPYRLFTQLNGESKSFKVK